jgi:NAD-dependent epimerase/dehydratase family protein
MTTDTSPVLVTGGTGYVGGRLIPLLERRGVRFRCLARRPEFLRPRVGAGDGGRGGRRAATRNAVGGSKRRGDCVYLVHSLGTGKDFEDEDRAAARNFAEAARRMACGASSIISAAWAPQLSKHLRSRQRSVTSCASRERAGDRVPRLDRHRPRQPVVRVDLRARSKAPGDAVPEVGFDTVATDRDRRLVGLPARRPRPARWAERDLRDRRTGSRFLRRHHACRNRPGSAGCNAG